MIYVPGLIVGPLSGSAGTTFASSNPTSNTLGVKKRRRRSITDHTQAQKTNFSALMRLYASLSSSDFQAWADFGALVSVTGRLGRSYHLDSASAFMLIQRNLHVIGLPPNTTPPAYVIPPPIASAIVTATTAGGVPTVLSIAYAPDPTDSDTYTAVYALEARSAAQLAFPHRTWKLIGTIPPSTASPYDALAAYLARFPGFTAGQAVSVKLIPISSEGLRGSGILASGIAT